MKAIVTDCRFYNGTTQFAKQLFRSLERIGVEVRLYIPDGGDESLKNKADPNVFFYDLYGSYLRRQIKASRLAKTLENDRTIDTVFFADDGIYNRPIQLRLKSKTTIMFVQDPKIHSLKLSLKQKLMWVKRQRERKKCFLAVKKIVVLSNNAKKQLVDAFPTIPLEKIFVFPLGPHPSNALPKKPIELAHFDEDYLLFFGSIEKYKNHDGFLKMFDGNGTKLIIAGKGNLSEESQKIIDRNKNIILINRFIRDDEMVFLFSSPHCRGNVLPYTDATQSGVLVMGLYYGVPAIVSKDPGLTEFVEEGATGFICDSKTSYFDAIVKVFAGNFREDCVKYCSNHLSYENNWRRLLIEVSSAPN